MKIRLIHALAITFFVGAPLVGGKGLDMAVILVVAWHLADLLAFADKVRAFFEDATRLMWEIEIAALSKRGE